MLPIVNGKPVRSKYELRLMCFNLLRSIGYSFDPFRRPVPPVLRNKEVSRSILVKLYWSLLHQIEAIRFDDDVKQKFLNFAINENGFVASGNTRIYILTLYSDGKEVERHFGTIDTLLDFHRNFIENSHYPNKYVIYA